MSKTRRSPSLGLIVLAGGLSTRMGRDKAGLPWHDTDLLTDLLLRSQAYPFQNASSPSIDLIHRTSCLRN